MNLAELESKLIAAARAHPPGEQVPYAFEQRVMAQIRSAARPDPAAFWARSLWRAALSCMAVVVMLGAFSWLAPLGDDGATEAEFEATVLAPVHETSQF